MTSKNVSLTPNEITHGKELYIGLSETEQQLRLLYEKLSSDSSPECLSRYYAFLSEIMSSSGEDIVSPQTETAFRPNYHIQVSRHPRYLPDEPHFHTLFDHELYSAAV